MKNASGFLNEALQELGIPGWVRAYFVVFFGALAAVSLLVLGTLGYALTKLCIYLGGM